MKMSNSFMFSAFLIFILALPGIMFGQRVIDLDKVWGDMRVLGAAADDYSGEAVAYGDINGDGFMDIIIGAPNADPGDPPRSNAGETYVIFGSSSPSSTLDLSTQSADITIYGDGHGWSGCAVSSGNVNGDGYDDIIIGASQFELPGPKYYAGITYIIFGSDSLPSTIDLSTTSADITINGAAAYDQLGTAVASGNINNDGYDDVIIGAPYADPGTTPRAEAGKTYVIFGGIFSPLPYTIDLETTPADLTINGADSGDNSGFSVASGNVNGDDYHDIIIGAPYAHPGDPARTDAGETYVIFGYSYSPPYTIDLPSPYLTIYGDDSGDSSGYSVASGDLNDDGYDDIIIGAPLADPGDPARTDAGETYVIYGSSLSSPPYTVDLSSVSAGITVYGNYANGQSGNAVSSGDINGDGKGEIIIGARYADPHAPTYYNSGETYVFFGLASPPRTYDLSIGPAHFTVYGDDVGDNLGFAVTSGDVNSDGYDDLIVGANSAATPAGYNVGETYLIAGGGAIIASHGLGGTSWIKQFSLLNRDLGSFKAFGAVNSQGEVHLAIEDLDADGHDEIGVGHGEGGKSRVKLFDVNGSLISSFKTFGDANTNGEVHLAIGEFFHISPGMEIVIAHGEGGKSWVKLFKANGTFIWQFKAFGAANAQGEVHLAAADLENADGIYEIIAATGEGGSSVVKIFSWDGSIIHSFQAFNATNNPGGEVHLALGNFDADADLEIAAATGYNGSNKVKLFEKDGTFISQFDVFLLGGNPNGDVHIASADIDNDGVDEILCAHGEGGSSSVHVCKVDGTIIKDFKAFGAVNTQGEVHLGKSNY